MRRISFALTTNAVLDRSKDVTRRLGWLFAEPGEYLLAVDKLRTKNARRLAVIRIVSLRREPLFELLKSADGSGFDGGDRNAYALCEMAREGFPDLKPLDFVELFTKGNGLSPYSNNVEVTRIEFRYIDCEHCGARPSCVNENDCVACVRCCGQHEMGICRPLGDAA